MTRAFVLAVFLSLASGCSDAPPRNPNEERGGRPPAGAERTPPREEEPPPPPDPWSVEAQLPRSDDPSRPNCKVEVTTLDVSSARGLAVRARVAGSVVHGVVNLRAAVAAAAGESRARSRTSSFIVVQAGREAEIALEDQARAWCGLGPSQALWVHVIAAGPDGVELEVAPVSTTTRRGERVTLATRVSLRPGEAVLLGGASQSEERESRSFGGASESSSSRELAVLLVVDVLG